MLFITQMSPFAVVLIGSKVTGAILVPRRKVPSAQARPAGRASAAARAAAPVTLIRTLRIDAIDAPSGLVGGRSRRAKSLVEGLDPDNCIAGDPAIEVAGDR